MLEVALNNRLGVVKTVTINPFVERARAWSERQSEREQAGHARWLHSSRLCYSWAQLELTTNPSACSHAAVGIRAYFMPPKAWEVQKLSLCDHRLAENC